MLRVQTTSLSLAIGRPAGLDRQAFHALLPSDRDTVHDHVHRIMVHAKVCSRQHSVRSLSEELKEYSKMVQSCCRGLHLISKIVTVESPRQSCGLTHSSASDLRSWREEYCTAGSFCFKAHCRAESGGERRSLIWHSESVTAWPRRNIKRVEQPTLHCQLLHVSLLLQHRSCGAREGTVS